MPAWSMCHHLRNRQFSLQTASTFSPLEKDLENMIHGLCHVPLCSNVGVVFHRRKLFVTRLVAKPLEWGYLGS